MFAYRGIETGVEVQGCRYRGAGTGVEVQGAQYRMVLKIDCGGCIIFVRSHTGVEVQGYTHYSIYIVRIVLGKYRKYSLNHVGCTIYTLTYRGTGTGVHKLHHQDRVEEE